MAPKYAAALLLCLWSGVNGQDTPAERAQALVDQMTLQEKIAMVHGVPGTYIGNVLGNDRLGIPALKLNDGPQGFRDNERPGTSTCFPSGQTVSSIYSYVRAVCVFQLNGF
jgi:beta-glucosidase-like glycosyl hydrolase